MNKSRLIWGIACLVIAGGLAVANLVLPPENLMFQFGDANVPWLPPVVLAVVGIVLLATAGRTEEAREEVKQEIKIDPGKAAMNKRLESMAWGLFLVMLGGNLLIPDDRMPGGVWSIGLGLILLGLNAARYYNGIRMSGFTTFLGLIALLGGLAELIWKLDIEGALLLIILGGYLILKPYIEKQQLFGKAEQS